MEIRHRTSPAARVVGVVLFALPVLYVSMILSTATHEILGHGLCAVLLGGEFCGFVLNWDGMGWAYSDLPVTAPFAHHILHLASGVIANLLCGAIFLALVFFIRKKPYVQLALFIVSFVCLIDGVSYVLWNAYHPVPPGDIGMVIRLWSGARSPEGSAVRWVLLIAGGLLFAGTTFYFCTSAFARFEAMVLGKGQFTGRARFLASFLLVALPGSLAWFTFDWNQLAPGIGLLPCAAGAFSMVGAATLLLWYRPKWRSESPVGPIPRCQIALSWMCLIITVMVLVLWTRNGVRWE